MTDGRFNRVRVQRLQMNDATRYEYLLSIIEEATNNEKEELSFLEEMLEADNREKFHMSGLARIVQNGKLANRCGARHTIGWGLAYQEPYDLRRYRDRGYDQIARLTYVKNWILGDSSSKFSELPWTIFTYKDDLCYG